MAQNLPGIGRLPNLGIKMDKNVYKVGSLTRGASLRLFCYPGNRFLIRSVKRVTVHNSEICKKGRKQK